MTEVEVREEELSSRLRLSLVAVHRYSRFGELFGEQERGV